MTPEITVKEDLSQLVIRILDSYAPACRYTICTSDDAPDIIDGCDNEPDIIATYGDRTLIIYYNRLNQGVRFVEMKEFYTSTVHDLDLDGFRHYFEEHKIREVKRR